MGKVAPKSRHKEGRDSSPAPSTGSNKSKSSGKSKPENSQAQKQNTKPEKSSPMIQLTEDVTKDMSVLRQPIDLGMSGAAQVAKCLQYGTQEVYDMLVYECDLIYECKVCRSMFRGLPNFMAHKRVYCTEQYKDYDMQYVLPHLNESQTVVVQPEAPPETIEIKDEDSDEEIMEQTSVDSMQFPVMEKMLQKQTELDFYNKAIQRERLKQETKEMAAVKLSPIKGNPNAVFQSYAGFGPGVEVDETIVEVEPSLNGRPVRQPKPNKKFEDYEMETEEAGITVVRPEAPKGTKYFTISPTNSDASEGPDGKPLTVVDRLRMRGDCSVEEIKCFNCNSTFTTVKSLGRHMKALHSNTRVYYPCLFCPGIFSQTSSAVRHMVRAHDKPAEEAESLRPQIREHSFIKQVEEFDIGDEMKSSMVRNWMMKKDPEIDPGTELRTTVSTENIISTPRIKGALVKPQPAAATTVVNPKTVPVTSGGKFRCPCGKFFNSSWNFTQHAMACKVAKAKKVKIPEPVKIKNSGSSPAKADAPSPVKSGLAENSPKKSENKSPVTSAQVKKYRCHICKKMFGSSWNYAQHIRSCASHKRRASLPVSPLKTTQVSPVKTSSSATNSPVKSSVPKSPSKGGEPKSSSTGSTCKSNAIQLDSSDSDDSKSSDEEEVVIKPIFLSEKKQAKQIAANKKKSDQRSKSPSGGGKEKKHNGSAEESPPGTPPKLSDDELSRIRQIVSEDEMRCLKCHKQYCTISYLHRHAVRHLGWRRFKCKLCKFTAYNRSECTTHLRKVHTTRTMGVRDMNPFIHDLEKMKQEPSVLTRVERPTLQRSNSNHSSTNGENYNISTRRNTRVFDTKPYVRNDDDDDYDDVEDIEQDDDSSSNTNDPTTGVRSNAAKRKNENNSESGPPKRKRTHSEVDSDNDEAESNEHTSKGSGRSKSPRPPSKKQILVESSDGESETEDTGVSPSRRKSNRPQKSVNGSASESERNLSPARAATAVKTPQSITAKLVKQSSGGASNPAKMSQKIQDLVQSDVDNILQMVQGNKVQNTQNKVGTNRDEVVILVVGENKTLSPMKAVNTSGASQIKLSLAPKVISSPGGAVITTSNSGSGTGVTSRVPAPVVSVRSPVKILPKPANAPVNSAKIGVFDKLAMRQLSQTTNATVATIPAPVTTVTAASKSPRRQQSVQK